MINLLPLEIQHSNRAARLNLKLRSYIFILLAALVAVVGIFGAGYYLTLQDRSTAEAQLQQHELETARYADVRKEAKTFADNLKIAKSILSQETLYSDLIVKIAKALPSNAVLTTLTLDSTSFGPKPITLNARVKSETDALVLKSSLENSSLFEDVRLTNVMTDSTASSQGNFPVTVTLTTKLSKQQATGANR